MSAGDDERLRECGIESSSQESNSGIFSPEVLVYHMAGESPGIISLSSNGDEAVMITECDGESYNTATTLQYCRRRILKPRDVVFSLLGYRSWNKDGADQSLYIQVFNVVYFIFLFVCLGIGPVLQYNICLKRDQGIGNEMINHHKNSTSLVEGDSHWCSGSLIFVYIVPSLMFFFAFLVTCVTIRLGESEHLQTLLERVYLVASCSPWELVKQRRIWCIFVGWLMMGIFCLSLSLASMILHIFAASHISYSFIKPQSLTDKIFLCGGALASLWLEDIVLVLGVLLYCTQCHLLSRLLDIIRTTLYQGATSLMGIKKQIDESARYLHHLNQELGLSVGLYLCLVAFRAITAACSLFSTIKQYKVSGKLAMLAEGGTLKSLDRFEIGKEHNTMENPTFEQVRLWFHISAMITNLFTWLLLTMMPLCMAARVSSNYRSLSKAGCQLHGRPFGYQSTPQLDIDSFLLYVSSLHLRAKILWIPVRTYFLVSILVLVFMSLIVLSYLYL